MSGRTSGEGAPADAPAPIDPRLRAQYCFGCGEHNPIGLRLHFERDGEGVSARYRPRREDQGFPDLFHGGLLSLLLDEAMGWAMYADEIFAVTARMETRFRRPVPLEGALIVRSRIRSRRGRRLELEAELCHAPNVAPDAAPDTAPTDAEDGTRGALLAEASGLFVRMPPAKEQAALARFREEHDEHA